MINPNNFRYGIALSDRERKDEEKYLMGEVIWMTEQGAHGEDIERWLGDYASDHYLKIFPNILSESDRRAEQSNLVFKVKMLEESKGFTPKKTRRYLERASDDFLSAKDCPPVE